MKTWRAILISVVLGACGSARAINFQDLWWNPSESGWGVNIAQQSDTLFATWFIYGTDNRPYWIVMPGSARLPSFTGTVHQGALYSVTGPYFGMPTFNPANVVVGSPVGMATFTFTDAKSGTLVYTVNGVTASKTITRQNIVAMNLTGSYYGGFRREASGCANSALNGSQLSSAIYLVAGTTDGANSAPLSLTEIGGNGCRFTGSMVQYGSTFEGSGSYTCDGATGTWSGREGLVNEFTFSMRLSLTQAGETCTINGSIGGFKPQ